MNPYPSAVKPTCSVVVDYHDTAINVSMDVISLAELAKKLNYLRLGGHYVPGNCSSKHRVSESQLAFVFKAMSVVEISDCELMCRRMENTISHS